MKMYLLEVEKIIILRWYDLMLIGRISELINRSRLRSMTWARKVLEESQAFEKTNKKVVYLS